MSSIMAVRRGIECTSGLMYESNGKDIRPLLISEKTIRTVNGASSAPDNGKGAKNNPNIQKTQFAALSEGYSELVITYNLKFLNAIGIELLTQEEESFKNKLLELSETGSEKVKESQEILSKSILNRIVSAMPTWRNRSIALSINTELTIKELDSTNNKIISNEVIVFSNVDLMGMNTYNQEGNVVLPLDNIEKFNLIANKIQNTLFNKGSIFIIEVKYILNMGSDKTEVYPSELMIDDKKLGKQLYQINGVAAITSQKIQNALRRYDNSNGKDIPVGEWGADLSTMQAFRNKRKSSNANERSFYFYKDLLNKSASIDAFAAQIDKKELVYFQGVLVKGGLFGENK